MSRKTKQTQVEYFKNIVKKDLEQQYCWIRELNGGSFRICLKSRTIDFYPGSGKYHDIDKNIRGTVENWSDSILKLF